MINALIFDCDGLLIDTETPAFDSWQILYRELGHELRIEEWQSAIGTRGGFDALEHLAMLVAGLDRPAVLRRRQELKRAMSEQQPLLPGVREILQQAHILGLPCAVASSSDRPWVTGWLQRHSIIEDFVCIRTSDDVVQTKPAPDLFLSAAACMGVPPAACLVFEDSPNGILAAHAAGARCVAVPGAITRQLILPPADLVLPALDAMPLADIIALLVSYELDKVR